MEVISRVLNLSTTIWLGGAVSAGPITWRTPRVPA